MKSMYDKEFSRNIDGETAHNLHSDWFEPEQKEEQLIEIACRHYAKYKHQNWQTKY